MHQELKRVDLHLATDAEPVDTELISAETLARWLDLSVRTLWRLRSAGQLPPAIRLGGSVRWRVEEIRAWIAAGCPEEAAWEVQRNGVQQRRSR